MAFDGVAYLSCQSFADVLPGICKTGGDERDPIFFLYLLKKDDLTKTIERAIGVVEDVHHHVSLAAVETVGGQLLLLPYGTHLPFHVFILGKEGELLKLINTDDDIDALVLCQCLRKLQDRQFVLFFGNIFEVKGHKVVYLVVDNNLRDDTREKLLGVSNPTVNLTRRTGYNLTGKHSIELSLGRDAEGIDIADMHFLVFFLEFCHGNFYQR